MFKNTQFRNGEENEKVIRNLRADREVASSTHTYCVLRSTQPPNLSGTGNE